MVAWSESPVITRSIWAIILVAMIFTSAPISSRARGPRAVVYGGQKLGSGPRYKRAESAVRSATRPAENLPRIGGYADLLPDALNELCAPAKSCQVIIEEGSDLIALAAITMLVESPGEQAPEGFEKQCHRGK